jgi:hypothetical protein
MTATLRRLRHSPVWLEVRANNVLAQRLYRRFGFRPVSSFSDSRGRWDVMVLDPVVSRNSSARQSALTAVSWVLDTYNWSHMVG